MNANTIKSSPEIPKWGKITKDFANTMVYANNIAVFKSIVFEDKHISELDLDANIHAVAGVYCILNSRNGCIYAGVSGDIKNRLYAHKRDLAKGRHVCKRMGVDFSQNQLDFVFFAIECAKLNDYRDYDKMMETLALKEATYINSIPPDRL